LRFGEVASATHFRDAPLTTENSAMFDRPGYYPNTAKQSINLLDVLTLDELKALTDEELRRFEALLSHWQQLAQGERKKRFGIP
jgi:hypothetical protein